MKNHEVSIGLIKIPVSDFAQATQFYREKRGLEEAFAVEAFAFVLFWARAPGTPRVRSRASMHRDGVR